MPVLPDTRIDQIQFCETHVPVWEGAFASLGVTLAAVQNLKTATVAARDAFDNSQSAREASKAATGTFYSKTTTMRTTAADLIRTIKAFADSQPTEAAREAVYNAAQIPLPAPPTPQTAPGRPTDIAVTLESSGAVTLSWEAENAAASTGGFFGIMRKLPGQGAFVSIGGAPGSTNEQRRATFTDFNIPASAASAGAQYIIQGRRGTLEGEASDAFIVQFGFDGSGSAVSVSGTTMKMAA